MSCRPGHPPRHPDFEPGNTAHLVHGADSPRAIEAVATEVHEALREVAPWLDEPHFAPAVYRYLRATAREQLLDTFIAETAEAKGAVKVPSRTWEQATAATRLAHNIAGELGLTPLGQARLKAIAGTAALTEDALVKLQTEGNRIRIDAEARMASNGTSIALGDGSQNGDANGSDA